MIRKELFGQLLSYGQIHEFEPRKFIAFHIAYALNKSAGDVRMRVGDRVHNELVDFDDYFEAGDDGSIIGRIITDLDKFGKNNYRMYGGHNLYVVNKNIPAVADEELRDTSEEHARRESRRPESRREWADSHGQRPADHIFDPVTLNFMNGIIATASREALELISSLGQSRAQRPKPRELEVGSIMYVGHIDVLPMAAVRVIATGFQQFERNRVTDCVVVGIVDNDERAAYSGDLLTELEYVAASEPNRNSAERPIYQPDAEEAKYLEALAKAFPKTDTRR